jgi:predicted GH43/DUF377 family glycosyl hydrolase
MVNSAGVSAGLVERTEVHLSPDPARVMTQLFVAGEELDSGLSRASPVMQRVLAMDEAEVEALLNETLLRFQDRHVHLAGDLLEHFDQLGRRLGPPRGLTTPQRMLLGAYATSEYALEAVSLCNPSIVAHPDQQRLNAGEVRFVLSLRAVGEGHRSSIEFRTGVAGPRGRLHIDDPGQLVVGARQSPSSYDRVNFAAVVSGPGDGDEVSAQVLDRLEPTFTEAELEQSIGMLHPQMLTRHPARDTLERMRIAARSTYTVVFPEESDLGQRALCPRGPTESHGMEDARFVRFVEDDGGTTYYATYTAYDGTHIAPQLIQTDDFVTFRVSQLAGRAATNKGMALFPRRIAGRYVALSRWDRERNAVTTSVDAHTWDEPIEVQAPEQPWELIQVGNCGSPIETSEGWLVFTHGVGPMRTYSIGAMLLDLDEPTRVRGKLRAPLLSPDATERNGYVPNVVYTCGALLHGDVILLPYAHGDSRTTFGRIDLAELLDSILSG